MLKAHQSSNDSLNFKSRDWQELSKLLSHVLNFGIARPVVAVAMIHVFVEKGCMNLKRAMAHGKTHGEN
jgi:hypothetical protein